MVKPKDDVKASGLSEVEKTYRQYMDILERVDQDAQHIIDQTWEKAESLIASQEEETKRVIEEMRQKSSEQAGITLGAGDKEGDNE